MEVMFLGLSVCLSLSVCLQDYSKSYEWILMKFFGGVQHGPGTKWIDFQSQEFFKVVLSHFIRQVAALVSEEVCAVPAFLVFRELSIVYQCWLLCKCDLNCLWWISCCSWRRDSPNWRRRNTVCSRSLRRCCIRRTKSVKERQRDRWRNKSLYSTVAVHLSLQSCLIVLSTGLLQMLNCFIGNTICGVMFIIIIIFLNPW